MGILTLIGIGRFFGRVRTLLAALRGVRFIAGVLVLGLFTWLGARIGVALHLPVPGSVIGMVLLAAAVRVRVVPMWLVKPAADFFVRHLALFYVPAGVSLILYTALLREAWLPVAAGALASLVAVLLVVGIIVQRLEREPVA